MAQRRQPFGPQNTIRRDRYGNIIDEQGNPVPPGATGTGRSYALGSGGRRYTGGGPPGSSYGTPDRAVSRQRSTGDQARVDERTAQRIRALTADEEAAQFGAPGSGGFNDPRLQPGANNEGLGGAASPYEDYLNSYMSDLAGSYDAQIEAIAGLGPLFRQSAERAQGNIGDFYGYAGDVAREGIPVTEETYGGASQNVNQIYDNLGGNLQDMPAELVDIASQAAGSSVGSSVAGRVASATAPFMAAGETARANSLANLTQHESAGKSYLNNLASAAPSEAAMHQATIEDSLNQQIQQIAVRQAEIEGSKQRALAEISADIAGESSERMANAALSQALGLNVPGGVDPLDYLRAQGMQQDMTMGQLQQEEALSNLASEQPGYQWQQATQGLSTGAQSAVRDVRRIAETNFAEGDDPRNLGLHMLRVLDDMATAAGEGNWAGQGTPFEGQLSGEIPAAVASPEARAEIERAIRQLTGVG